MSETQKKAHSFLNENGKELFNRVKFSSLIKLLVEKKIITGDEIRESFENEMDYYTKHKIEESKEPKNRESNVLK